VHGTCSSRGMRRDAASGGWRDHGRVARGPVHGQQPSIDPSGFRNTLASARFRLCFISTNGSWRRLRPPDRPRPGFARRSGGSGRIDSSGPGGRYVPEGNGPVNFDCSGLTAWSWRQAGVYLDDLSYTQRAQTQNIPRSMVQPGDLAF